MIMDSEKSSLNPSSIFDLKAELHKKYDSFNRAKLSQKSHLNQPRTFKHKDQVIPKEKKTQSKVTLKFKEEINEEELEALKKSQLALEAKAKLYEKITSSNTLIDDEENEKYLVDFQRKVLYSSPVPITNELPKNKPSNSEEKTSSSHSSEIFNFGDSNYENAMKSNTQNVNKEEEIQTDQPIHYQNVLFKEVRDHGTGYYAFSTDESKRKEQMEELKMMRQQTEEQRLVNQRMQRKRKTLLEARLAKVCERRNIDKSVVQTYTNTEDNAENPDCAQGMDLNSIPLPETPEVHEEKEIKTRPWDIGKTDFIPFVPEKKKTKSQNDWIQDRRSERETEFAPPSYY